MPDCPVFDFDPRNLPSEILEAVDMAITSASNAEVILNDSMAGCLGIDVELGLAVTAHMAVPLKISILKSCAEIRIDDLDLLDELDEILSELQAAMGKRNNYAHHQLGRNPETNEVFSVETNARASLEVELVPLSIDKIKTDAVNIYNAGIQLYSFMGLHSLLPPFPSPRTPRQEKSKAVRKKRKKKNG